MANGKDRKPQGKFVPSRDSVKAAEIVASLTGRSFDPEAAAKTVKTYHEDIFASILENLELDADAIDFISGSFRNTTTFAAMGEKREQIVFDETFDFWTWGITHYACISVFEVLSEEEWSRLIADFGDMLVLSSDANLMETVREGFWHYIVNFKRCLDFSHTLSKAILGFILCHEIAHCQLDHLSKPSEKAMEFEADHLATQHFIKLIETNKKSDNASFYIHPAQQAAPLISLTLLDLHETWLSLNGVDIGSNSQHPAALERRKNIEEELFPVLSKDSADFYQGFLLGIADFKKKLEQSFQ